MREVRNFKTHLDDRWFFILSTYLVMQCVFTIFPWTFANHQTIIEELATPIASKTSITLRFLFGLTGIFGLGLIVQMILLVYEHQRKWLMKCLSVSVGFSGIFVILTFISRLRNEFPLSQFSWTRLFFYTWLPFSMFMSTSSRVYADQKGHLHGERHAD